MSERTFRLVTRSDFDGLVSAVLFRELGLIGEIKFVHPKDMQDGVVLVSADDITTNLPYVDGVHLAFDHHLSETTRLNGAPPANYIADPGAPSASRVVYDHYGSERFPAISADLMAAVDKSDSGQFTEDEILNPDGWVLLNYLMDARTGFGRFKEFRISNYELMMQLVDHCRDHGIDDILALPDVKERVDMYRAHREKFVEQIRACVTVHGNLAIVDLRGEEVIYAGNRFMVYALFPDINISIHAINGLKGLNTVFAVGKSVLNRTSGTNIGELCLKFDGRGHRNAGTCQVENEDAEKVLNQLIQRITIDG